MAITKLHYEKKFYKIKKIKKKKELGKSQNLIAFFKDLENL